MIVRRFLAARKVRVEYEPVATFTERLEPLLLEFLDREEVQPNCCYVSVRFPAESLPLGWFAGLDGEVVMARQTLLGDDEVIFGYSVISTIGRLGSDNSEWEFIEHSTG